MILTLQRR